LTGYPWRVNKARTIGDWKAVEQVGIPSLTPKSVAGIPNWLRQNIQQWAYQAGLVRVGIPMDYLIQKRFSV